MAPSKKQHKKKRRTVKKSTTNIQKKDNSQMSMSNFIVPHVKKNAKVRSAIIKKKTATQIAKEKELIIINDKFYRTFVIGDPLNPPIDCTTEYDIQLEREKTMKNNQEECVYNSSDMSSSNYRESSVTSLAKGESLSVTSLDVLERFRVDFNQFKPI
jgi:hypothetical protein